MAAAQTAVARLEDMLAPVLLLRVFFLAASLLVLFIQAVPALRSRFLAYGSRATLPKDQESSQSKEQDPSQSKQQDPSQPKKQDPSQPKKQDPSQPKKQDPSQSNAQSAINQLLDYAASIQVPHNYFTHFYIISVSCSLFWAYKLQLWSASTQLQMVWSLMLLQGVRRMLESYVYTSSSKSRMWFVHWLLGLVFYVSINVAIWIEGSASSPGGIGWKTAILVPGILMAHVGQHTYHDYLYHLKSENKGYQLPSHPLFPNLLCPHYMCEVVIYALLSFLAAPEGRWVNWTLVCGAIFVATNLGVTAIGTKEWYVEKFGAEKVGPRRRMVPWVW